MASKVVPEILGHTELKGKRSTREPEPISKFGKKKKSGRRILTEWIVFILLGVLVAALLRTFVFQAYYIPSASMEPTLDIGDRILVDKIAYDLHGIGVGDIVVFRSPVNLPNIPKGAVLVKRVIALPGQTIYSNSSGQIFIDGKPFKDPWAKDSPSGPGIPIRYQKIPPNHYFVMGDNRGDSEDSRYFGPIPRSAIIGKVDAVIWRNGHPVFDWL